MKKRIFFGLGVAVLLISASFFYLNNQNKFSADSITNLPNLSPVNTKNLGPTVQLTSYTNAEITQAIQKKSKQATLDAKSKTILVEIDTKSKDLVNQLEAKSQVERAQNPTQNKIDFKGDAVIMLLDKDGNPVNPPQTSVPTETIKNVADNFIFDDSVKQYDTTVQAPLGKIEDILIEMYPKIEQLYGPRSNSGQIKIVFKSDIFRSYYVSSFNAIYVGKSDIETNGRSTLTHELIHAFHGFWCIQRPLWEEGMTEAASEILTGPIIVPEYFSRIEDTNLPFRSFLYIDNSGASNQPYGWGGSIFTKLYIEDRDFFKKFNYSFYIIPRGKGFSDSTLITLAAQATPKIEAQNTLDWFSHQYAFIPVDDNISSDKKVSIYTEVFRGIDNGVYSLPYFMFSETDNVENYIVKIYDTNDNLLIDCDSTKLPNPNVHSGLAINSKYCSFNKYPKDYQGLIKIVLSINGQENPKRVEYWPMVNYKVSGNYIVGSVIGSIDLNAEAIVTNIDTQWTTTVPVQSGVFHVDNEEAKAQGRYLIQIMTTKKVCYFPGNCITRKITSAVRQLNKIDNPQYPSDFHQMQINMKPTACTLNVDAIKPLNHGVKISAIANDYCSEVLRLNGVPIKRQWTKNPMFNLSNLVKNTSYEYKINLAAGTEFGKYVKNTFQTLNSAEDFKLVKAESFGNPYDDSFYRRYTFNYPYNADALKQIVMDRYEEDMGGGDTSVPIDIKAVNSTTFDIKPKTHIYNGAKYSIYGLQSLTNKVYEDYLSNPEYSFTTDPFPPYASQYQPAYTLAKNKIGENEGLEIKTNFNSQDLNKKLSDVKVYKNITDYDCINKNPDKGDSTCFEVSAMLSFDKNSLKVSFPKTLEYNSSFSVSLPSAVDDLNNFVPANYFTFSTLPKPGTEAPRLISSVPKADSEVTGSLDKIVLTFNNEVAGNTGGIAVYGQNYLLPYWLNSDLKIEVNKNIVTVTLLNKTIKPGKYMVYYHEIRDIYGNYLNDINNPNRNFSFSFTVK